MSDKIRWGMIGCGSVTEKKSAPALQQAARSELVAVASRTYAKAKEYASRKGIPLCFENPLDVITCEDVDAVYIATAPDSHAYYAIAALEAGKPVYVEKPMARTYDECLRMLDKQRETGVPLFVAYYRRVMPYFLKVKELLEAGVIGKIRSIDVKMLRTPRELDSENLPWRYIPEISGGGLFVDVGSHTLDILDDYFGPLKVIRARAENRLGHYPAEDYIQAEMELTNGTPLTGEWSYCEPAGTDVDEAIIVGSEGEIRFSSFKFTPVELRKNGIIQHFEIPRTDPVQLPMVERIVANLLDGTPAVCTAEDAARTNRIMDDILREYRKKQNIMFC